MLLSDTISLAFNAISPKYTQFTETDYSMLIHDLLQYLTFLQHINTQHHAIVRRNYIISELQHYCYIKYTRARTHRAILI
jgi:hypothetical protein